MKVLITGGNGFIGRSLVPLLLEKGHEIIIIDPIKNLNLSNEVKQFNLDFRDHVLLSPKLKEVDVVIHLAAILGVDNCEKNAATTLKANGLNACTFFDLCEQNGVSHIIYTSSSEVYGDVLEAKESEFVNPKSDYAIAKLFSERYLRSICEDSKMSSHILRLFSVYGKDQRDEFVIPKFIKQAKNKEKITIYGDGSQTRAFCHVSDIVKAIHLCLLNVEKVENSCLLNIGNDRELITISDLAEKIIDKFGLNSEDFIEKIPLKETKRGEKREIYHRKPSIAKAKSIIDYEPEMTLARGLSEFGT